MTVRRGALAGLGDREVARRELMDDPHCDPVRLARTYRLFRPLNALVARWGTIYRGSLRPHLHPERPTTLLDVGSGAGDLPRALARWAARDGLRLDVTAIDPDPRAHAFATARPAPPGLAFRRTTSADLVAEGARFDVVVSNHVLHHLAPAELAGLLRDSAALARGFVLHNDLVRDRAAYAAFRVAAAPLAGWTFAHHDGLLSIRRSHRPRELLAAAGAPWRVETLFPARLLLVRAGTADQAEAGDPADA